jgi:signal transduction histidine kinase
LPKPTASADLGLARWGRWLLPPLAIFWVFGVALQGIELLEGRGVSPAVLTEDADLVPRVKRVIARALPSPLRAGDRVLEIDGFDQRGALRFPGSLARWSQPRGLAAMYLVEREGETLRFEVGLLDTREWKLPMLLFALAYGVSGLLIHFRVGQTPLGVLAAPVMLAVGSILFLPVGSPLDTAVTLVSATVVTALMAPLATFALFSPAPYAIPRGRWFRWALAFIALRGLTNAAALFGFPGQPLASRSFWVLADRVVSVVMLGLMLYVMVRLGRQLLPEPLRRSRFVGVAFVVGAVPVILVQLAAAAGFPVYPAGSWALVGMTAFPIAMLFADFEHLDVDRIVTGSVATVALVGVALAGSLWILPGVVEFVAERSGFGEGPSVVAVTLGLVALGLPAVRRVTPTIESWLFPERTALRVQVDQLLRDFPSCESGSAVASLLRSRLPEVLRPRSFAIWLRDEAGLAPVVWDDAGQPPRLEAETRLAQELAGRRDPFSLQGSDPLTLPGLTAVDRHLLSELDPAVLVPVHRADQLSMVLSLGVKRSSDVYTPNDLLLLAALAEGAGAQLRSLEEASILAETRAQVATLDEASEEKTRFLATASHDLRQPLNALSLLVASLDDAALDPATRETVRKIRASTVDLKEMVEGVMDLSKLDAGAERVSISAFPLGLLLDRLALELRPEAEAAGLSLEVPETALRVSSDALLLRRILQNLLTNALKYTKEGGVRVTLRETRDADPHALWIDVEDTGPGLSSADQERLFAEWKRAERDIDGPVEGLGLGLSIVKRLAGWLDHPLDVASTPGTGSRFSVWVPIAAAQAGIRVDPPDPLAGMRVLVIEPDPVQRAALEEQLASWGCQVSTESADEARTVMGRAPAPAAVLWSAGPQDIDAALRAIEAFPGSPSTALLVDAIPQAKLGPRCVAVRRPVPPARLRATLVHLRAAAASRVSPR